MRTIHIYSALILAAVLTAGCAKEIEDTSIDRNSAAIELSSVSTDPMTKAVITGTSFTTDEAAEGIGLFLLDGSGKAYGSCPANVRYTFSSDKWTAASPLRVGNFEGLLYGYYPYNEDVTGINRIPVESSINGTDYLYAAPVEVTTDNAKSVSLSLNHALARVSLSFRLDESYVGDGVLSEISLSGNCVAASGTLDATDGSIDASASKFTAGTEQTLSKSADTTLECLIVPVAVSGSSIPDVKIGCIIDGKYFGATFTGDKAVKIIQGVQTGISFTVKNTSIEVDGSSIVIWSEGDSQTVTVGGEYTVTIAYSSDSEIKDDVWIKNVEVLNNSVVVTAQSFSGMRLKCTMPDGEFCTSQSKTSNLVYTFTISDITDNTTATIGYASPVSIAVTPDNSGSVRITGNAYEGETVTLTAGPAYRYGFDAWLDKDGEPLSCEEETYSNPVRLSSNGMSVRFKENLILGGEFSVASGKKVRFTRGNLYYEGSSKVEQHQYDFNSASYSSTVHISHFMWCNNIKDAMRQLYSTAMDGQSPFFTEVDGFTVNGFSANQCRTLTTEEWQYLFGDNDVRRGKYKLEVTVCGKDNCIVLLPDDWSGDANDLESNYDYVGWKHMEEAGAVCLPAAGYRTGNVGETVIHNVGSNGYYWSSTPNDSLIAYDLYFNSGNVNPAYDYVRSRACAVRLVTESK